MRGQHMNFEESILNPNLNGLEKKGKPRKNWFGNVQGASGIDDESFTNIIDLNNYYTYTTRT